MALSPGYLCGALGFRSELKALPASWLRREVLLAATGGLIGASLLLLTPAKVLARWLPWLLPIATALFAVGPLLAKACLIGRCQACCWWPSRVVTSMAVWAFGSWGSTPRQASAD